MKSLKEDSTEIHSLNSIRPWYFGNIYFVKQLSEELYLLICLSVLSHSHIYKILFTSNSSTFFYCSSQNLQRKLKQQFRTRLATFLEHCHGAGYCLCRPVPLLHRKILPIKMSFWSGWVGGKKKWKTLLYYLSVFVFYHHHLPP